MPLNKMSTIVPVLLYFQLYIHLLCLFACAGTNATEPLPFTDNNKILGIIHSNRFTDIDPLLYIFSEYVTMCNSGWNPTIAISSTLYWDPMLQYYLKSQLFCYRDNSTIPLYIGSYHPRSVFGLDWFVRNITTKATTDFDVIIHHTDQTIIRYSNFIAFIRETSRLNQLGLSTNNFKYGISLQRYYRGRRRGEIHHVVSFGEHEIVNMEHLEDHPEMDHICLADQPYLHIKDTNESDAWILTRAQVLDVHNHCNFLDLPLNSIHRTFASPFREGCGLARLLPADGLMTLGVHLYYPVEKHSQHKISTLKANDHILAGLPLSRNSNSISHTAHPNAPPPCWTEIIHMKRHEQQQVKEEKVLLPPHGAPAQSLGYNTGDIIIIGGDRIINYVGKDGKIHGIPNLQTFAKMGLDFDNLKKVHESKREYFDVGEMMPELH